MTTDRAARMRELLAEFAAPAALDRDQLLGALSALGELQAELDAVKVRMSGEVSLRSVVVGEQNPVTRAGYAGVASLLAERWRVSLPAARQLCAVGEAVASRISLVGERLPARFPAVSEALGTDVLGADVLGAEAPQSALRAEAPRLSVEEAAVIVRELNRAAPNCGVDELGEGERLLVDHAAELSVAELRLLAVHVRDRLDQDGIEPREERQKRRRSLTIRTMADGMTHVDWYLDPESAGYVVAAIDAVVGHGLRSVRFQSVGSQAVAFHEEGPDAAADVPDPRTIAQHRSDAGAEVFRHFAGCAERDALGGPAVTMVVRVDLETLRHGTGTAQLDGVASPVSAGAARRLAADARVIPVVLGGASEVLDLGRSCRLFSRAQRLALAERDDGCAWPGCPHPPRYTEAHHIR
ncbi:DUF222 domain-containing protein [Leifsonia sp. NPDC058248]|uniref:HNH endonuclease signature motif containing protein n=1 Tax=Leifsonia sp. NPDC058248 TaxID=3346402 RepID=UPI0036DA1538